MVPQMVESRCWKAYTGKCRVSITISGAGHGGKYKAWVIIAIIAVLLVVGAGLNIYFEVRGSGSGGNEKADSTSPETVETDATSPETIETDTTATNVPTGKRDRIAYLGNGDIYVIEMNGTGEKKLTNRGDIYDFSVSPNGQWIAFVVYTESQKGIFKIRSDGTQESRITAPYESQSTYTAFDPTSQYIYCCNERRTVMDIERYNIETAEVERVYEKDIGDCSEIAGLWADPKGGALYYNLGGSGFPSGNVHKITLGQQVTDSVVMPEESSDNSVVAYHLTGVSMDGTYVSYFKWTYQFGSGKPDEYICYREASGCDEKVVVTEKAFQYNTLQYSGLEFSAVSDNVYYYSEARGSETIDDVTLRFFTGTTANSSPKETGLILFVQSSLTWHLLATE